MVVGLEDGTANSANRVGMGAHGGGKKYTVIGKTGQRETVYVDPLGLRWRLFRRARRTVPLSYIIEGRQRLSLSWPELVLSNMAPGCGGTEYFRAAYESFVQQCVTQEA